MDSLTSHDDEVTWEQAKLNKDTLTFVTQTALDLGYSAEEIASHMVLADPNTSFTPWDIVLLGIHNAKGFSGAKNIKIVHQNTHLSTSVITEPIYVIRPFR